MVKQTQDDIHRADLQHVEIHQMNAEQLDFPEASFDRVLCGFALWFFPDPLRALAEFFRVLRPGGQVSLSVYAHESPYSPPHTNELQWMQWNTPPQLASGLTQAGFTTSQIIAEEDEFIYADEETVWSALWTGALGCDRSLPTALRRQSLILSGFGRFKSGDSHWF